MFNINDELATITNVVQNFESKLLNHLDVSLRSLVESNPNISISIENGYVDIGDVIDGEHINFYIYFNDEIPSVEVVKMGGVIGSLEVGSEKYSKYITMVRPIEEAYRMYFMWDGAEFLNNINTDIT